jgi:large repetitive protein
VNWNFTPTTAVSEGYHDVTFKVVNTTAGTAGAASAAYRIEVDATVSNFATIATATDSYGALTGNLVSADVSDAPRLTLNGTLDSAGTGYVKVFDNTVYVGSASVTNGSTWSYATDPLATGPHAFTAEFYNTAGVKQTAAASSLTINHQALDGVLTNLTTVSGVDTATMTGGNQVLDFTKFSATDLSGTGIDKVSVGAGNTVKLSTADVLEAGAGLFKSSNGWNFANATDGTHASTYHQMLLTGSSTGSSNVQLAEAANLSNTSPWALTGTATNGADSYNVYTNLASSNNAQMLIDQKLAVNNVVI